MISVLVAEEKVQEKGDISHILRKIFGQIITKIFLGKKEVEENIPIGNLLVIEKEGKKQYKFPIPLSQMNGTRK